MRLFVYLLMFLISVYDVFLCIYWCSYFGFMGCFCVFIEVLVFALGCDFFVFSLWCNVSVYFLMSLFLVIWSVFFIYWCFVFGLWCVFIDFLFPFWCVFVYLLKLLFLVYGVMFLYIYWCFWFYFMMYLLSDVYNREVYCKVLNVN